MTRKSMRYENKEARGGKRARKRKSARRRRETERERERVMGRGWKNERGRGHSKREE